MELIAALTFVSVASIPLMALGVGVLFALFCWGGWIGRAVTLSALALLIASQVFA